MKHQGKGQKEIITTSELELDYLKLMGDLYKFDASNKKDRQRVNDYLEAMGLDKTKEGTDWVLYRSEEYGIRAYFGNYPMKNISTQIKPSLSIEFSGHFFIRQNSWETVRKMARWFSKKFGVFFKINRVDIRKDIYGAKYPFDYFPNFKDNPKLYWATKSRPVINFYINDGGREFTGFNVSTSRYQIKSYNRTLALDQKLAKGKIDQGYYDHYKKIYKNRDVQRLEVVLKQDACKLFAILFFSANKNKEDVLQYTLANFGKTHALKIVNTDVRLDKWKVDPVFEDLFCLKKKNLVKIFKEEFSEKALIKFSDISFSDNGKSIAEIVKMLAKKICEHSYGYEKERDYLLKNSFDSLKITVNKMKDHFSKKRENFEKTLGYMDFTFNDLMKEALPIQFNANYG